MLALPPSRFMSLIWGFLWICLVTSSSSEEAGVRTDELDPWPFPSVGASGVGSQNLEAVRCLSEGAALRDCGWERVMLMLAASVYGVRASLEQFQRLSMHYV